MYNDLDDTHLTCIADLLQNSASIGPKKTSGYDNILHCVVGIVSNSVFREVPSKRVRNETYSVLDLEILDETCKVSDTTKQTLGVRLWGAITRDHLRHRFVEGSIILLDSVVLQQDTYRDGRLTLQQRSFHDRSISYVLCEDQSDDGSIICWFDGGNKLYPRIWLYPERYPKLCNRVTLLRQWAQQSHSISDNVSFLSLLKGRTQRARYVENFLEAAAMFGHGGGQRTIDICVPITVFALSQSNDQTDTNIPINGAISTWQFAGECIDGLPRSTIALSDKSGHLARLQLTNPIAEAALENCVKIALNMPRATRIKAPHCLKLTPSGQHPIAPVSSSSNLLGKRKFESPATLSSGAQRTLDPFRTEILARKSADEVGEDDWESDEERNISEDESACPTSALPLPTCQYGGRAMSVATAHLMVLLQGVRVQESAQNIATVLVADAQATFQALAMDPQVYQRLLAPPISVLPIAQEAPRACSWQQLASIVHDTSLIVPRIVSVQCRLKKAHFPAFGSPVSTRALDGQPLINLIQVLRSRGRVVSATAPLLGRELHTRTEVEQRSWAAATDLLGRTRLDAKTSVDAKSTVRKHWDSVETVQVNYRDAVFALGPISFALDKECVDNISASATEAAAVQPCQARSMPPPNRKSSETARYSQTSLDFYNTGGSTAPTPPATDGTFTYRRSNTHDVQPSNLVHALVRNEVLTRRIFNNIPAALAAVSHTRAHFIKRAKESSVKESVDNVRDAALVAALDQMPPYNYAAAVCRLANALVQSCYTRHSVHDNLGLLVDVELLISPVRDEHGMRTSLRRNHCVVRDMRFLET